MAALLARVGTDAARPPPLLRLRRARHLHEAHHQAAAEAGQGDLLVLQDEQVPRLVRGDAQVRLREVHRTASAFRKAASARGFITA